MVLWTGTEVELCDWRISRSCGELQCIPAATKSEEFCEIYEKKHYKQSSLKFVNMSYLVGLWTFFVFPKVTSCMYDVIFFRRFHCTLVLIVDFVVPSLVYCYLFTCVLWFVIKPFLDFQLIFENTFYVLLLIKGLFTNLLIKFYK